MIRNVFHAQLAAAAAAHDSWVCVGLDPEMLAKETIAPALVILGVACRKRAVSFHVPTLREKTRQVQETGGGMRQVGRRQRGKDLTAGAGNGPGGHIGKGTPAAPDRQPETRMRQAEAGPHETRERHEPMKV